jgi:MFS family permease
VRSTEDTAGPRNDDADAVAADRRLGSSYRKLFCASTISNLGDGVGQIAYPWLASAVTRNPLLIALVAVAQRLPWLLFSLPAGVITDRHERRRLMVISNAVRAVVTLGVALLVAARSDSLPSPDALDDASLVITTDLGLYVVLLAATMLLGTAEVLYDNTAQTIMPSLVRQDQLEKANGRLWSAEQVTNTIMGPALGAFLLAVAFSMPFLFDAVSFALSAFLVFLIPSTAAATGATHRRPWKSELAEGFRWLWGHELLRPLAVILGLLNLLGTLSGATLVLFAQEVLGTSTIEFAVLSTAGAVGGVAGGWSASWIAKRLGAGPSMFLTLIGGGITSIITGLSSSWPVVWLMFAIFMFVAVLWNVITVSLRQTIIPDHLLGRVNSVYRFFAWGMMPIGALLGGAVIVITERVGSRELALRMPWLVAGACQIALLLFAAPKLTTTKIEAARAAAT